MPVTKKLAPLVLQDVDGRDVRLDSLWKKQPIVLVFIRHFG